MDDNKEARCADCKICTMVDHCDRAFMREPATCEDYKITHVEAQQTGAESAAPDSDKNTLSAPEEIVREAVPNGVYSPAEARDRVLGADSAPEEKESGESVVIRDAGGNVIAKYGSVQEHIAAMEKAVGECAAVRRNYDDMLARINRDCVVIDKNKAREEYPAFVFLNGAIDSGSATTAQTVCACIASDSGRLLVASSFGRVHVINVELFDFVEGQTYRVFKNSVGLAYVPYYVETYPFDGVRKIIFDGSADWRQRLHYAPKRDATEWLYMSGVNGLPAFLPEQLKPLAAFSTPWTMHVPAIHAAPSLFTNGDCRAFLWPSKFSVAHLEAADASEAVAEADKSDETKNKPENEK